MQSSLLYILNFHAIYWDYHSRNMCSPRLLSPLAAASWPGQMPSGGSFPHAAWRQALLLHCAASYLILMPPDGRIWVQQWPFGRRRLASSLSIPLPLAVPLSSIPHSFPSPHTYSPLQRTRESPDMEDPLNCTFISFQSVVDQKTHHHPLSCFPIVYKRKKRSKGEGRRHLSMISVFCALITVQ